MEVATLWRGAMRLGEGPAWDAARGVLWFVDIKAQRVHRFDPRIGMVDEWPAPAQIGWVLPADDGCLLAGLQTGLHLFDPDAGGFDFVAEVEPDVPSNRLNDATVAADGAVIFGSMDDGGAGLTGRLYRWDGTRVALLDVEPVAITNGPAIAPDGRTLYHVDTAGGVIHALDFSAKGVTSRPRQFARIDPADGHPDGIVTDAEGGVWTGLWGGGRARRYRSDGTIDIEVWLPAANITKVALGGDDLRTAYVTSASVGLTAPGEDDGALFSFRVETPGRALPLARSGRR